MLLDPEDVGAGHVVRFRKAAPDRVVRSRKKAHPHVIEVEDFVEAQSLACGWWILCWKEAGEGTEADQACLPASGTREMWLLRSSDGGHAARSEDLSPLCTSDDGARFARAEGPPDERLPARGCGYGAFQQVD